MMNARSDHDPMLNAARVSADEAMSIQPKIDELWPKLVASVEARRDEAVQFRRALHAHPEASGQEWHTTATVANALRTIGYEPKIYDDDIGVTVDLDLNASSDQLVALRAELDCVGVDDEKDVAYRSVNRGLCHACGHDAHTTIVLEAMTVLHEHREALRAAGLRCNVRGVFQPAEESAKGAASMIKQGAVENVAAILAVHVDPFLEPGRVGVRTGPLTSSSQAFEARVFGRSGHTARPFEAIDPIPAATSLVNLFYELGPRSMDPRYPLSLSVAAFHAGAAYNAIPDTALIGGTLRTTRQVDLDQVRDRMNKIARGVAEATDTRIELDFQHFVPPTNNDATLVDVISRAGQDIFGVGGVQWIDVASLGAEDFSFYQSVVPGAIVRLGAAMPEPAERRGLHNSRFDIDERALAYGTTLLLRSLLYAAVETAPTSP